MHPQKGWGLGHGCWEGAPGLRWVVGTLLSKAAQKKRREKLKKGEK